MRDAILENHELFIWCQSTFLPRKNLVDYDIILFTNATMLQHMNFYGSIIDDSRMKNDYFFRNVFNSKEFFDMCYTAWLLSRRSFWPEFRIVWLPKMPASGWGSLWESSSFVPWFALNAFRDITGVVLDLPWISGFMRKLSFTWVKWVGNVSLYRNYPQNIRSIGMYSVLYPESSFWWVFRNGSGLVPETFHNTFLGCSSKFFLIYCCHFLLFRVAIF